MYSFKSNIYAWGLVFYTALVASSEFATAKDAATVKFTVEWNCPQSQHSYAVRTLPEHASITFPHSLIPKLDEWKRFIAPVKDGNTDYTSCILDVENKLRAQITHACATHKMPDEKYNCKDYIKYQIELVSKIGLNLLPKNAIVPPLVPSGSPAPTPATIMSYDKDRCVIQSADVGLDMSFIQQDLPKIMRNAPDMCKRMIIEQALLLAENISIATQCTKAYSADKVCDAIHRDIQTYLQAVMSYKPYLATEQLPSALASECYNQAIDKSNYFENLKMLMTGELLAAANCNLPGVGAAPLVFKLNGKESMTGIARNYGLRRIADKEYEVIFNLRFSPFSSLISESDLEHLRESVVECASIASDYLLGPNGEKLRLRLADADEQKLIPKVEIKLYPDSLKREASDKYTQKMGCPTVVHELLHLTGLVDEYEEKEDGYVFDASTGKHKKVEEGRSIPMYDCRIIGPKNSIMNNQAQAFYDVFESKTARSLLLPGHFRAIVQPDCYVNNDFYACSHRSYESKRVLNDNGTLSENVCSNVPLSCSNGSAAWLEAK